MKTLRTCLLLLLALCLLAACQSTPEANSQPPESSASRQESSAETSMEASSEEATSEVSSETSSEESTEPEPPREGAYMSYEIPDNYKDVYENPFALETYEEMEITASNNTYTITYRYPDGASYRTCLVKKRWGMWMLGAMEYTHANGTKVRMSESSTDYEWVLSCGKVGGNITFRGGNHGDYTYSDWNANDSTKTNDHFIDMTFYDAATGEKVEVANGQTVKVNGLFVVLHNNVYEDAYEQENVLINVEKLYLFNGESVSVQSKLYLTSDVAFGNAYTCMFPVAKKYGNYIMFHNDDGTTKVTKTPITGTSNYGNNFDDRNKASKVTVFGEQYPAYHMTIEIHNPEDQFYQSSHHTRLWDMNPSQNKLYFSAFKPGSVITVKKDTEFTYSSSWTFSYNPDFELPEVDKELGFKK